MSIAKTDIERVLEKTDIVAVIGEHLPLKAKGRDFWGPCPFHAEKTGSFKVDPSKQRYHCFGCGEDGRVIDFLMKIKGVDFRDALEDLSSRAGVEIRAAHIEKKSQKEPVQETINVAWNLLRDGMSTVMGKKACELLHAIGISAEELSFAGAGFWDRGFMASLLRSGVSRKNVAMAGLAGKDLSGQIVIPVLNMRGRPCAFISVSPNGKDEDCLCTGRNDIFDPNRVFIGLSNAARYIREGEHAVVSRGPASYLALKTSGIGNVVALPGATLSVEHGRVLAKYTWAASLAVDGTRSGKKWVSTTIPAILESGISLACCMAPDDKTIPAWCAEADIGTVGNALSGAPMAVEWLADEISRECDLSTSVGKYRYVNAVSHIASLAPWEAERTLYCQMISLRTGIPVEVVQARMEKSGKSSMPIRNPAYSRESVGGGVEAFIS